MTPRRLFLLAGSLALAITLMALLFELLGITFGDLARTLNSTPAWLALAVVVISLFNQVISVVRWRALSLWLAPNAPGIGWGAALKATSWGSFLGQFLPLQFSVTLARWAAVRSGTTVGATLYEGLFDFVVLISGACAAVLLLVIGINPELAFAAFCAAIVGGCLSIRWLFRLGSVAAAIIGEWKFPGSRFFARLAGPLDHASRAPANLLSCMVGWSVLRLAILSLRLVLVAGAFVGALDWTTVAIGYTVVGIALAIPFLPAGLGVADWSLVGILVLAGATAPIAATAAAAFRLLNIFSLGVLVIGLMPFRMKHRPASAQGEPLPVPDR